MIIKIISFILLPTAWLQKVKQSNVAVVYILKWSGCSKTGLHKTSNRQRLLSVPLFVNFNHYILLCFSTGINI